MVSLRRDGAFLVFLLVVAAFSFAAREINHQRFEMPGQPGWRTADPDTHYHLRRVERLLREGGAPAGRDDYLDFPHGSAIPWPPYYTQFLGAVLGPFAPADAAELHRWLEMRVATLPLLLGVVTSLLAAVAGRMLAGNAGALIAGSYHALCVASIVYSKSGNGDHHAWVSLLAGALLVVASAAFARGGLTRARAGLAWGAALGALAGVLLGSWVASALYVLTFQLTLGWLVIRHAREPLPGLPALGFAFHVVAMAVLLPAIVASPWRELQPWQVVNLTWFHAAWLGLGALVFVPLLVLGGAAPSAPSEDRQPRRSTSSALRLYPAFVAAVLLILGAFLALSDSAPAHGIRESFHWLGGGGEFMGGVRESRGLIGPEAPFDPVEVLGFGIFLLPFVWFGAARSALRNARHDLLPWVIALPFLCWEAARQSRFADALALPLAVMLAWGCVHGVRALWQRRSGRKRRSGKAQPRRRPWPAAVILPLVLAGVILAQWDGVAQTVRRARSGRGWPGLSERPTLLAVREMCDWLRANTPATQDSAVLASWMWGHTILWGAEHPVVACNFGSFVGRDGFLAPYTFFLSEDPAAAEAVLEARRARYILATGDLAIQLPEMITAVAPDRSDRYFGPGPGGGIQLRHEWFRTLGARLMFDGRIFSYNEDAEGRGPALGFVRLVHVSPRRDDRLRFRAEPNRLGWIWEHVPGAILEARGEPGSELRVELQVRYEASDYELTWSGTAHADATGFARLRVPYATDAPNGDGVAIAPAWWSFGGERGELAIPEAAVRAGDPVHVPTHSSRHPSGGRRG
jgi:asparagine N-glycosylation enzyme membrane subunit Stt3